MKEFRGIKSPGRYPEETTSPFSLVAQTPIHILPCMPPWLENKVLKVVRLISFLFLLDESSLICWLLEKAGTQVHAEHTCKASELLSLVSLTPIRSTVPYPLHLREETRMSSSIFHSLQVNHPMLNEFSWEIYTNQPMTVK